MQWVRSLAFTVFLFVSALCYGIFIVVGLSWWLSFEGRYAVACQWARLQLWALRVFCGLHYRVSGREHLPAGTHVILCKHSSAWETIAQMAIFPRQAWVLKRELLWIPFVGWSMKCMRPIGINRSAGSSAVREVVAQGRERLAAGQWVVVFPEGTRVAAGHRHKYGISGALLASEAGCKIVPVAHNAGRFWARRGLMKHAGTIEVIIGPPMDAGGKNPRELTEQAREWIDAKTTELGA
jgi:1-acyl-sn-glycerol-3-phosphate acyltransferase